MIEKAVALWAKAGQRSLARSAFLEATEQITRALSQIALLPATSALLQQQITLQIALITPLGHVKGWAAPETKTAVERAHLLIEQAEAVGVPAEDRLLLFSVLFGSWITNYFAFNGDVVCELAVQFMRLSEKQGVTVPLMIGHRLMGVSLLSTGDVAKCRSHFDQALALYDPERHRPLATRFGGQDVRVVILAYRALALWMLGYPDAGLADAKQALKDAREIGQAVSVMHALLYTNIVFAQCGYYAVAIAQTDEVLVQADASGALFWKAAEMCFRGILLAQTGKASDAVRTLSTGLTAIRSTGMTQYSPTILAYLATAYSELGQFHDAWRSIGEAMSAVEKTNERWWEAEVSRIAGDIALRSPERDAAKPEAYFERALAVARQQQAKSWELRAAMSLARLWRDQGKPQQARELLAPVYGWFAEGFDTRDLKEANALLKELAA